jgi:transcriptional regulator with XRE-family HTH domain
VDAKELATVMGAAYMREMRRQGLSIVDVAERSGIDKQTIGNFVGGRRARVPTNRVLKQLQTALNLSDEFFNDVETSVSGLGQDHPQRPTRGKDLDVTEREIVAKAADLMLQAARMNSEAAHLLASIAQQSPPPPVGEGSSSPL